MAATTLEPKSTLFHVALATHATADLHAHTHNVTRAFPRIGETGTAEEVIELLERST